MKRRNKLISELRKQFYELVKLEFIGCGVIHWWKNWTIGRIRTDGRAGVC